jgi:ABC-type multidrug transport system permease subunit
MICKNCNAEIDNNSVFCANCGTPVENEAVKQQPVYQQQSAYQQPVYQQQPAYQQPVYQQPYYEAQPVAEEDEDTAPITTVGQYVGWFFLLCIPGVSLILMIVFACIRNRKNNNRANFFAAILAFIGIILAIAAVIAIIVGVFAMLAGGSMYYY